MQYYARWIGYTFLKLWIQTVSLKYVLIFKTSFKNISLNKQKTSKCHERRFKTQEDKTQINIEYIRQSLLQFNWLQKNIFFDTWQVRHASWYVKYITKVCYIFIAYIENYFIFFGWKLQFCRGLIFCSNLFNIFFSKFFLNDKNGTWIIFQE